MRENYLKNLIKYLEDYRSVFLDSYKELESIRKYYSDSYNDKSATDTICLKQIENLCNKFSYVEKYIDVSLDFYKEKI